MKKLLLFSTVLLAGAFIVNAQNGRAVLKPSLANKVVPINKNVMMGNALRAEFTSAFSSPYKPVPSPLGFATVGYTYYDLQSNNSSGRRIINHPDGTVSMVWTVSDAGTAPGRGTGWNYWTGSALKYPLGVSTRLESVRTGFGQIGLLGNGNEVIMAHGGAPYDFQMSTGTKGSGTWTGVTAGATIVLPTGTTAGLWGRMATGGSDGNSIHLINGYYTDGGRQLGVTRPMTYSRSTDAGATWDQKSISLPGYDSTRILAGSAENYSIDAEGSTVAIIHGGLDEDLTLWKSTNNGTAFTRTFIDSNIFAPLGIDSIGGPTDTIISNDGTMSVVVASNGSVHAAYATVRMVKGGFFPGDVGLVYWNDITKTKTDVPIQLADIDAVSNGGNGNSQYDVAQYTTSWDGSAGPAARYGNNALLCMPSITVEGTNVYILFSLPADGDSTADGQSFRAIWVIASQDNGVTWGPAQNISCVASEEHSFPCLAKRVDTYLHVLYQWDTEPGLHWNGNVDQDNSNEIRYVVVKKADVLAGTASCSMSGNGILEQTTNAFNVSDNYPNPATGLTNFDITMKQNGTIALSIYNGLGQEVYVKESKLSIGKHLLTVDASNFASGLYFYTINSGKSSVSGKFTKE